MSMSAVVVIVIVGTDYKWSKQSELRKLHYLKLWQPTRNGSATITLGELY